MLTVKLMSFDVIYCEIQPRNTTGEDTLLRFRNRKVLFIPWGFNLFG